MTPAPVAPHGEIDTIITGDARDVLRSLPDNSVNCCVTSPPYYGLRDYGVDGQIGLEPTPDAYVAALVEVFREVRRVLTDDGTCWLNLGDSFANDDKWGGSTGGKHAGGLHGDTGIGRRRKSTGMKPKDLLMIPARVALALQADGWWLRSDIIWNKPNCMPESVTDRPTKSHEYVFLLTKSANYWYDHEAIREPLAYPNETRRPLGSKGAWQLDGRKQRENGGGSPYDGYPSRRNKRSVWTIPTQPYSGAHFAVMPEALVEPCILAGCPEGGTVIDPFGGAATVGVVAKRLNRRFILIELNPDYAELGRERLAGVTPMFPGFAQVTGMEASS